MAKTELGKKHVCQSCGARFYDLKQVPPTCPKCGFVQEVFQKKASVSGKKADASDAAVVEKDQEIGEIEIANMEELDDSLPIDDEDERFAA